MQWNRLDLVPGRSTKVRVEVFTFDHLFRAGSSIRLTLNVKLQQAAEKALAYGIGLAQGNGEWAARGGAITDFKGLRQAARLPYRVERVVTDP